MTVSAEDRQRWQRQVSGLREVENDDEGTPQWRQSVEQAADQWRVDHGIARLKEWWEDHTEPEFYERARTLGLLGRVR